MREAIRKHTRDFAFIVVLVVVAPPPGWNRTYWPLPSKFWPSPESPTSVCQKPL